MDKEKKTHIEELEKNIRVLEWDKKMNQLNVSREAQLQSMKDELKNLVTEQSSS